MRTFLFLFLTFSSVVFAQNQKAPTQKNVCDPNSPLLNQLFDEGGLKKELEKAGDRLVGHIGNELYFKFWQDAGGKPECQKVLNELSRAQFDQGVLLTGYNCEAGTFSFNVPGFIEGDQVATNRHTQHGVFGESYKSSGKMTIGKSLNFKLNRNVQQMRIEGEGTAYRYDENGLISHEIAYVKQGNQYRLSCSPIAKKMDEKIWQLNHTLPTLKTFAKLGVCHSGCGPSVNAMIKKNQNEIEEGRRGIVPVNKIQRDPDEPCMKWQTQSQRDGCLPKELLGNFVFAGKGSRPKCAVDPGVNLVDCADKECNFFAAKNGADGCLSNALLSAYNQRKCPMPPGGTPQLCQATVPQAQIPIYGQPAASGR